MLKILFISSQLQTWRRSVTFEVMPDKFNIMTIIIIIIIIISISGLQLKVKETQTSLGFDPSGIFSQAYRN